jgi:phosphohistidine phosphatase
MYLYLIRHGIAIDLDTIDANRTDLDRSRHLTKTGRKKIQQVAKSLKMANLQFDRIVSSPLVRAQQTAELLIAQNLSSQLELSDDLAPSGNLESWLTWWESRSIHQPISKLALVGHEPNLSEWAELLIFGNVQHKLVLKKGGLIALKFPTDKIKIGTAQLHGLIPPKYLLNDEL